jgi:hypothetical protein
MYKVKVEEYNGKATLIMQGHYPEAFMTAMGKLEQELVKNFENGNIGESEIIIKLKK